jgi:hypothetical protein
MPEELIAFLVTKQSELFQWIYTESFKALDIQSGPGSVQYNSAVFTDEFLTYFPEEEKNGDASSFRLMKGPSFNYVSYLVPFRSKKYKVLSSIFFSVFIYSLECCLLYRN